jgi:DNA-binding PadR family transcriptional regulator
MVVPSVGRVEMVILAALSRHGSLYGLQIIETIRQDTNGAVELSLGGLYTTLHRMERKGLIRGRWGESAVIRRGARRRYYSINGLGERALTESAEVRASKFVLEGAR